MVEVKQEVNNLRQDSPAQGMLGNNNMGGGMKRASPLHQYSNTFNENQNMINKPRPPFGPPQNGPMSELSPAAQTLKHMAEQHQQHQHRNNMPYIRQPGPPQGPQAQNSNQRPPYPDQFNQYSGNDFMNNQMGQNQFNKNNVSPFPNADMIKQEMMYNTPNDFDLKRLSQMTGNKMPPGGYQKTNQQYSPYGSPGRYVNYNSL